MGILFFRSDLIKKDLSESGKGILLDITFHHLSLADEFSPIFPPYSICNNKSFDLQYNKINFYNKLILIYFCMLF